MFQPSWLSKAQKTRKRALELVRIVEKPELPDTAYIFSCYAKFRAALERSSTELNTVKDLQEARTPAGETFRSVRDEHRQLYAIAERFDPDIHEPERLIALCNALHNLYAEE